MHRSWIILGCIMASSMVSATERKVDFHTNTLNSIFCSVPVPEAWDVYDRSTHASSSWIITPDDLNKAHYNTGVRIDTVSNAKINTGVIASKWVEDRIQNKSTSLPIVSLETGPTNDYFRVIRLVTQEVYSPGRTEYVSYRRIYSWFWNDEHDVVICMEAQTPEKSWSRMAPVLERIGKLEFNVSEWKKKLKKTEE